MSTECTQRSARAAGFTIGELLLGAYFIEWLTRLRRHQPIPSVRQYGARARMLIMDEMEKYNVKSGFPLCGKGQSSLF
jgi:hypothetical protein